MYISVQDAAQKFNISPRRVQILCEQGRIPGARMTGGIWQIPDSAQKPRDGRRKQSHEDKDVLTVEDLCSALAISKATAKNWIRLGKITPDADNQCFSPERYFQILDDIRSGKNSTLKNRRNKKSITGKTLYKDYIATPETQHLVQELLELGVIQSESDLRILLACFAVQLYFQSKGIPYFEGDIMQSLFSREDHQDFITLVSDLLGGLQPDDLTLCRLQPALSKRITFVKGEDSLGFVYISLRDMGQRKSSGVYYTPAGIVNSLLDSLRSIDAQWSQKAICDPCCGTGNFLLGLASGGIDCAQLYGQDIDPVSVYLARINVALMAPQARAEDLRSRILIGNTLYTTFDRKFDIVLGNPPWGSDFSDADMLKFRALYKTANGKHPDSCDLFVEKGLSMLRENGVLAYILPEAILSVAVHGAVRELLLRSCSFKFASYLGNVFSGVQCPSVILGVALDHSGSVVGCQTATGQASFVIAQERSFSDGILALHVSDEEYACLQAISGMENAACLKENAKFALGIVTGNNREFLSGERKEGYEPVLKGSDIYRYGIKQPDSCIRYMPESFQQAAPTEIYRAKEKLLYRFICEVPVFAYDDAQTLSLNSCNILIPQIPGLPIKYILAILNSSAAAFYISRKFHSVKLLRSHIEQMPIPIVPAEVQEHIVNKADRIIHASEGIQGLYKELDEDIMELYRLSPEQRKTIWAALEGKNLFLPPH